MARAGGQTYTAADVHYRERWHTHPSPHANTVHHTVVDAAPAMSFAAPCFQCEARGDCRHRSFEPA